MRLSVCDMLFILTFHPVSHVAIKPSELFALPTLG